MEINRELMQFLERKSHGTLLPTMELYQGLWKKWPQINPMTRLQFTNWHEIRLADTSRWEVKYEWVNHGSRKGRLWRALGELFNREGWKQRGMSLRPLTPGPFIEETIHLETFGWSSPHYLESVVIRCAYHPRTDTLYIQTEKHIPTATEKMVAEVPAPSDES